MTTEYEREVRALHEFFAAYYRGETASLDRLEGALAPGFEMVTPDGVVRSRADVIDGVSAGGGDREAFRIEIRNPEVVDTATDGCLLRYEEWQYTSTAEPDGRISTALLRRDDDAPGGVRWEYVHETALE